MRLTDVVDILAVGRVARVNGRTRRIAENATQRIASLDRATVDVLRENCERGRHRVVVPAFRGGTHRRVDDLTTNVAVGAAVGDEAIAEHCRFADRLPTPSSTMHMYPIDGAVHDVPADASAFRFRDANWAEVIVGVDPDPAGAAVEVIALLDGLVVQCYLPGARLTPHRGRAILQAYLHTALGA